MILYPAIDLKDGQCVRLIRGDMDSANVYNDNPADQARAFEDAGFGFLHVVDLNGAFAGRTVNAAAIEAILKAVRIPIQLGGGIRTLEAIGTWLEKGVARIILGTAAVRDPQLVRRACNRYPGRIAVAIDARGGRVAIEGWARTGAVAATELARRLADSALAAIVHTDIERDGILKGLNIAASLEIAHAVDVPVIASGGLSSMDDIRRLAAPGAQRLGGAIAGRALYDGRIDGQQALRLLGESAGC